MTPAQQHATLAAANCPIAFDNLTRQLYATDASHYQIEPVAVAFPRATSNGAFVGLIAGMASVAWAASFTSVAFLWHNVIGALVVVIVGLVVSSVTQKANGAEKSKIVGRVLSNPAQERE
jgi:sorbitol-specific phosphotransferase system component IIC